MYCFITFRAAVLQLVEQTHSLLCPQLLFNQTTVFGVLYEEKGAGLITTWTEKQEVILWCSMCCPFDQNSVRFVAEVNGHKLKAEMGMESFNYTFSRAKHSQVSGALMHNKPHPATGHKKTSTHFSPVLKFPCDIIIEQEVTDRERRNFNYFRVPGWRAGGADTAVSNLKASICRFHCFMS